MFTLLLPVRIMEQVFCHQLQVVLDVIEVKRVVARTLTVLVHTSKTLIYICSYSASSQCHICHDVILFFFFLYSPLENRSYEHKLVLRWTVPHSHKQSAFNSHVTELTLKATTFEKLPHNISI